MLSFTEISKEISSIFLNHLFSKLLRRNFIALFILPEFFITFYY